MFLGSFQKIRAEDSIFQSRNTYLSSEQSSSHILKLFSYKREKKEKLLANIIITNAYLANNATQ